MTKDVERLRILVADDESATRMVARALLERRGHIVAEAADGAQAVAAVTSADPPFDAALMDVNMPESDGLAALAAIRALEDPARAGLAVIMLTSAADPGVESRLIDEGADAALAKPLRWDALAAALRSCLAVAAGESLQSAASPIDRLSADLPPEKVARLVEIAYANLARYQADLRAAALCGDGAETARLAHKIVGVAGTYGCDSLRAAAALLEKEAQSLPSATLAARIAATEQAFSAGLDYLKKFIG